MRYLNRLCVDSVAFSSGSRSGGTRPVMMVNPYDGGDHLLDLYRVEEKWPTSIVQRPDREAISPQVNAAFDELEGVLSQPRHAVIACRRILEITLSAVLNTPKNTLSERIGQAQAAGLLTKEIAQWARELKQFLNGSAHEGDAPTAEQAREVHQFTCLLVELMLVYPQRIQRLKAARTVERDSTD